MSRTPASHIYDGLVEVGELSPDKRQRMVIERLDQLAERLIERRGWSGGRKGLFRRQSWTRPEQGLYLWGGGGGGRGVGCGLGGMIRPERI